MFNYDFIEVLILFTFKGKILNYIRYHDFRKKTKLYQKLRFTNQSLVMTDSRF